MQTIYKLFDMISIRKSIEARVVDVMAAFVMNNGLERHSFSQTRLIG